MKRDAPAIVALGEAMIEFNQTRRDAPHAYVQGFGGDTSNAAIAAARLGAANGVRVAYLTRVGGDRFGRMLQDLWRAEDIDVTGVDIDPDAPTGIYFVSHGEHGHVFDYRREGSAAARMTPAMLHVDLLREAQLLHVSGISQAISGTACDTVFAAIEVARSAARRVSYDPNHRERLWPLSRARAVVVATLALCDFFLPNIEEARLLSGRDEIPAILDWAHRMGAPIVALKCGVDGVVISDGDRAETIPAHRVKAVDTTGAGDCFDGAFLARIAAGDDPRSAARYANAAAALATTGFGAVAPLPRPDAVAALLADTLA